MKAIRVISILIIVTGVIGVILGSMMFGDIGIAALIGAITAILSGICFLMIGKKLT